MQALIAALACLLALAAPAQAQVAQVVESKGTSLVERAGAAPRVLGANEKLDRRDTVRVARGSWVILEFTDRTRITLRPDTVFRIDAYEEGSAQSMLTGLLKGGLRAVTGLIGKQNPDGVKIQTATATIGIRGTEFDARLCEADCTREEQVVPTVTAYARDVAARVVELKGFAAAAAPGGGSRLLAPGAALYEGDGVATGPGGYAVLVFRDGARVSMEGNSRLAINRFRYRESAPADGSAYLTLYAGQAHVWTGRLAKISPDAFLVRSAIGVIRPHGTGFSVSGCIGSACGSVSGNVSSSGASGSASGSAGNTSASASGSAGSSGASGSATASAGGTTASASGSAGSSGGSATIVTPFSTGTMSAGPGGVTQSSSSPLGTSNTGIGPGGVSVSTTGVSGSASLNVGAGGVSGSGTQNLPGGASVTVGGNASVSNQGTVSASGSVTGSAGGQTATVGGSGSQAAPTTRVTANQEGVSATFGAYSAQAGKEGAGASYQSGTVTGPGGTSVGVGGSVGVSNQGTVSASGSVTGSAGGQTATVGDSGSQAAPTTRVQANQAGVRVDYGNTTAQMGAGGASVSNTTALPGPAGASVTVSASAPPPPPPASEVVNEMKNTGQDLVNTGQNAANNAAASTQNAVNTVMQGAQDVVAFVSRETQSQAGAATQKAGQLGQAAKDSLAAGTQAAITKVQATFSQGAQAAGRQAANASAALNDARAAATAGANQVSDAAVQQAVNALNAATAPIVAEMTALMTQLRNNPPQTEATGRELPVRAIRLSQLLNNTISTVSNANLAMLSSEAFRAAAGTFHVMDLVLLSTTFAETEFFMPGLGAGEPVREMFNERIGTLLGSLFGKDSLAAAGLSFEEMLSVRAAGPSVDTTIFLSNENARHLASRGESIANPFLAEAQTVAVAAQRRAEQDAARAATETNRRAGEAKAAADAIVGKEVEDSLARKKGDIRANAERSRQTGEAFRSNVDESTAALKEGAGATGERIGGGIGGEIGWWIGNFAGGAVAQVEAQKEAVRLFGTGDIEGARRASTDDHGKRARGDEIANQGEAKGRSIGASIGQGVGDAVDPKDRSPESSGQSEGGTAPQQIWTLVWNGEVEVAGKASVRAGGMLTRNLNAQDVTRVARDMFARAPRPDLVKVDPNLFGSDREVIDAGLYVWVRDGTVQLSQDGRVMDVTAGNGAVATKDKIELLDAVPNFMRFDPTPIPTGTPRDPLDIFRAPDGSQFGSCKVQ